MGSGQMTVVPGTFKWCFIECWWIKTLAVGVRATLLSPSTHFDWGVGVTCYSQPSCLQTPGLSALAKQILPVNSLTAFRTQSLAGRGLILEIFHLTKLAILTRFSNHHE